MSPRSWPSRRRACCWRWTSPAPLAKLLLQRPGTVVGEIRRQAWSGQSCGCWLSSSTPEAVFQASSVSYTVSSFKLVPEVSCRRRRRVTLRKETASDGEGISLLGLTPGTPFMERVAQSLQFYACQRLQNSTYHGVAFEISGATVPVSCSSPATCWGELSNASCHSLKLGALGVWQCCLGTFRVVSVTKAKVHNFIAHRWSSSCLNDHPVPQQGEGEMKMAHRLRAPWPDAVKPGDTHLMIGGERGAAFIVRGGADVCALCSSWK